MSKPSQSQSTLSQTWVHALTALFFMVLATLGFSKLNAHHPIPGYLDAITRAAETLNCEGLRVFPDYTGIEAVDQSLRIFVVAVLPGVAGLDKSFWAIQVYFLFSWFPIISIWAIEAGRKGNKWSFLSFPAICAVLYQTIGGAVVCPSIYLGYLYTSRRSDYFSNQSRAVSTAFAKALLPALLIGYLLPTILMYLPFWDERTQQTFAALWLPCPLFPSLLATVLTPLLSSSKDDDIPYINTIYVVGFAVAAATHVAIVAYCFMSSDPKVSLSSVFDFRIRNQQDSIAVAGIKYTFQIDFCITFTACLTWAFLAIYDLKQLRRTNTSLVQAVVLLVSGSVLLGPAATVAATWYWREQLLIKTKRS